ncbi:MAG: hypothetical protein WCY37_01055 [Candidatus Dojkabacteria bacterium]
MKKVKSQKSPARDSEWKNFIRAVFDIKYNVQVTKRYLKGKLFAKANMYDEVGVKDKGEQLHFNLKKKVFFVKDPNTGDIKEVPFTKEQEDLFKKTGKF